MPQECSAGPAHLARGRGMASSKKIVHDEGTILHIPYCMNARIRNVFGSIILSTAVLGAGCATTPAPAAQQPNGTKGTASQDAGPFDDEGKFTIDPCALITKADAESILGGPLVKPIRSSVIDPDGASCSYYTDKSKGPSRELIIIVLESDNIQKSGYNSDAKEYFAYTKKIFHPDAETVPNLGDSAFWSFRSIEVLKGDTVLDIHVQGFDEGLADIESSGPKDRKVILDAASLAVSRLK